MWSSANRLRRACRLRPLRGANLGSLASYPFEGCVIRIVVLAERVASFGLIAQDAYAMTDPIVPPRAHDRGVRRFREPRTRSQAGPEGRFDIELVLKRLLEKGRIVFKRAYCDWTRYQDSMREFHRQGFELIDIPHRRCPARTARTSAWSSMRWTSATRRSTSTPSRCHGRQRLLAARLEAEREQQAGDRLRRAELDVRPARQQLRRVHLLRRPARVQKRTQTRAASRRRRAPTKRQQAGCPRSAAGRDARWSRTTIRCGARS